MVSPADAARYRRANRQLEDRIERDIRRLWDALGAVDAEDMRDALLDYIPGLVSEYGRVAATIAAEYFEETTGGTASLIDTFSSDAVAGSIRYHAGGLWTGNRAAVLAGVSASARRHMLQPGRSTLYESASRNRGVSFARVPEPGACEWCLMLSSRGAVYAKDTVSRVTVGHRKGETFHDDCRCDGVAVRDGDALPYDAEALYEERYLPARLADPESLVSRDAFPTEAAYRRRVEELTGMTDRAIAARMRVLSGGH